MVSRIISTLLITCILSVCLVTYLDFTELIDLRSVILNRLEKVPSIQEQVRAYKLGLLGQQAILEKQNALELALKEVEQRRIELDERESKLNVRERQLDRLAEEINKAQIDLDRSRQDFDKQLERLTSLERLADMYGNMKGSKAAAVLQELSPEFAATILAHMDDRSLADVLSAMDPRYASEITRIFSTMGPSDVLSEM